MHQSGKKLQDNGMRFLRPSGECGFSAFDLVLFAILSILCFFSFAHEDILTTGNRSWLMYDGVLEFYDNSYLVAGNYGANYLPSTFFVFAIWNLPLKLLGVASPTYICQNRITFMLWYKLLPVMVFMLSGVMLFQLARQVGMGKKQAKLAMYLFLTCPVAFFSQMIFSQYDIFAVALMLLGMRYYFRNQKGDWWKFSLCFGAALTFKYFVLLIFLVLLVLREKKVSDILKFTAVMVIPFVSECLPYLWSDGFMQGVFGFKALSFVTQQDFETELASASFCKILCVVLLVWTYFTDTKDETDHFNWAMYFCCGICFVLFGLMTWNPQWLIFAAPFWTLSMMTNRHREKLLWLELVLVPVFYSFVMSAWESAVDNTLLNQGVWKYLIRDRITVQSGMDYLLPLDNNTLFSVLIGLFLVFFLFKHPKYCLDWKQDPEPKPYLGLIRARLIAAVLLFAIPSGLCAYDALYNHYAPIGNPDTVQYRQITVGNYYQQTVSGQEGTLESVYVYLATYDRVNKCDLQYEIQDITTGEMMVLGTIDSKTVVNCDYNKLDGRGITMQKDHVYSINIYSTDADEWTCIAVGLSPDSETEDETRCLLNGDINRKNICMVLKFVP